MPIQKNQNESVSFPVSKYGLYGHHHVLLEACSFPPEKRSSMSQSCGPMTALLMHIRSEEKYRAKWTNAAKRALAQIPFIDDILAAVKGKPASEIAPLVEIVANLALHCTTRHANRMFFPLVGLVRGAANFPNGKDGKLDFSSFVLNTEIIKFFNVSGVGGYYLYKRMCETNWKLDGKFTQQEAGQVTYHCIFGTFKEDLSLLSQITNTSQWKTREELGECFKEMGTTDKNVVFPLPTMKYYSKLASASQTKLLAGTYFQTASVPVFSGIRSQGFTEDYFEQARRSGGTKASGRDIRTLIATLSDKHEELLVMLERDNRTMDVGTVDWFSMEELGLNIPGARVPFYPACVGEFFLGRRR